MDYQEVNYSPNPNAEELDQLNLDTTSENWGNTRPARDPRALGSKIISTPENTLDGIPDSPPGITHENIPIIAPDAAQVSPESLTPEIAETPLTMPPGMELSAPVAINPEILAPQPAQAAPAYELDNIKTADRATPETISAAESIVKDFNQNGDPEKLVESYADLVDLNLGNSYADREASRQRIQEKRANASDLQGVGN